MACRGVHFALSEEEVSKLLQAESDDGRLEVIQEEIEQKWDEAWLYQTDKAWDAIHRCLTDGTLKFDSEEYPLSLCILGGRLLYSGDDYIISLKTPAQVEDVAKSLARLDHDWLRQRYFNIRGDYCRPKSEDDFAYTWDWFNGLGEFFSRAAAARRHVIFTVDQ